MIWAATVNQEERQNIGSDVTFALIGLLLFLFGVFVFVGVCRELTGKSSIGSEEEDDL
jgi:hypothetical protein